MAKRGLISRLRRAENFDIGSSAFFQFRPDRPGREFRRIAIPAEMPEHDPRDFAGQQLRDHGGRGGIGKMAVPRLNPLFHRPGPMRIVLQKFLVVVRLNDESLHLAQTLNRQAGGMPEVGDITERVRRRRGKCSRPVRPRRAERRNFPP